jgi:predicted Zn-dependent protease
LPKSEQLFEHLLAIRRDNMDAHTYLADILFRLGKFDKAIDEIDYCLGSNPRQPALLALKGKSLYNLEKLDDAETTLLASLSLNPRQEDVYETLAFAYGLQGQNEKVIEVLTRWQNILPPRSARRQILERQIEEIKSGS